MPASNKLRPDADLIEARRQLAHIAFVVETIARRLLWHARIELLSHDTDLQVAKANIIDRAAGGSDVR